MPQENKVWVKFLQQTRFDGPKKAGELAQVVESAAKRWAAMDKPIAVIVDEKDIPKKEPEEEEYRGVPDERDLQLSKVLSAGAIKALQEAEINTVDELVSFTKAELLALDGIGENSVKTIEKVLAEHKLKLATEKAE